eukprot:m.203171 g.203171  ORF g.203171 m.203171 type:complete len:460 (+) comp15757_c0_seq1:697-2076(+)
MYSQYNFNPAGAPPTMPRNATVNQAQTYESRDEFFEYFFNNVDQFFWNAGLCRIPNEEMLMGIKRKSIPLPLGTVKSGKIGTLGTISFCTQISREQCLGNGVTFQVDVLCNKAITLRLKKDSPAGKFSSNKVVGQAVGNHNHIVAAGPATQVLVTPGFWFVTISAVEKCEYSISTALFEDNEKSRVNSSLFGNYSSRTVLVDDKDEWEEIVDEAGPAEASEQPPPYDIPMPTNVGLTQASDLTKVSEMVLRDELLSRGAVIPAGMNHMGLCAMLFPLLSAPPQYAMSTGPSQARQYPLNTQRASAAPQYPHTPQSQLPQYEVSTGKGRAMPSAPSAPSEEQPIPTVLPNIHNVLIPKKSAPPEENATQEEERAQPQPDLDTDVVLDCPATFVCPLTLDIMIDPVFTADGHTYERDAIQQWLQDHDTSPLTGLPLPHKNLIENFTLRAVITEFNLSKTSD